MDGVGIGELPDADRYGDVGSNTLVNTSRAAGGLQLPNLERLGLGNVASIGGMVIEGVAPASTPAGAYGRMKEASAGKDTTTGHWEIAGIISERPFPTYPHGFPDEVILPFEKAIGRKILGNKAASGTEIIKELGEEHMATGRPIVYTSADSVFQIAAHEDVIPPDELYRMCQAARGILRGKHGVARVIARPFAGKPGAFTRTPRRRDFSIEPPQPTLLDLVSGAGLEVTAIGKIEDIFAHRGITRAVHTADNLSGLNETRMSLVTQEGGLIFTNCVDFDMLFGHRNDPIGFARALMEFDRGLGPVLEALRPEDVLFITGDHGGDPTTGSTDHSREYVPLLAFGSQVRAGVSLGTRETFADLGRTALDLLGVRGELAGRSFMKELLNCQVTGEINGLSQKCFP